MPERAQTTFDFATGITLFLLVVAFAFTTVPGFLAPYQGGGETESLVADRAADQLVSESLTAGGRYRLTNESIESFFDSGDPASTLGINDARYGVWVTLNSTGPASEPVWREATGEQPPDSATVSRSRRVVNWEGRNADLTVEVWS